MAGPSVGFGHQTESRTRGSRDAQPVRPQQERAIRGQEDLGEQELRHHTGKARDDRDHYMPICFRSAFLIVFSGAVVLKMHILPGCSINEH